LKAFSEQSFFDAAEILTKLGIAVILGGAVGYERERHGRPAGLRTHMLVAMGVTLFCLVSASYAGSDPTRISAQVVTGIGFLGAGTILRLGAEIKGLTSAASIWATSAIAMAVARGDQYLIVACVSTVLALITLSYVERIEKSLRRKAAPSELILSLRARSGLHEVLEKLSYDGIDVNGIRMIRNDDPIQVGLSVMVSKSVVLESISSIGCIESAQWAET
jgi:putative Mg2+ transporter-C (MgtC) family protein